MRKIQLKDAKATLSSVVNDAVRGQAAVITMSVPIKAGDLPRRNGSPVRRVKL
jgi:hypothetical protein